jgi:fucose permease
LVLCIGKVWSHTATLTGADELFQAALSVCELLCLVFAFWKETASIYRQTKRTDAQDNKIDTKAMFRYSATWICAAYFLAYVGTETAISGWVVSFMMRTRDATLNVAGSCSTGFWMGMAIGRLVLGFVTDRIGVRRATALYFVCAIGLEALFAIWDSSVASVVLMTLLGFVMGPLFPSGVVVLTRLLPVELHIAAVSFVSSLGQIGGAFFPFAIGAVVESLGIGVFRFAILAQTVSALVLWLVFARVRTKVLPINTSENNSRMD